MAPSFYFLSFQSDIFLFTTQDNISLKNPEHILDNIWNIGHEDYSDELYSILDLAFVEESK